jgi:hypothetical protein
LKHSVHVQVHAALDAALQRYSGPVLGLSIAKALLARLLPDATRTVRMWRMFLPIWVRCRWLKWRVREERGYTKQQVRASALPLLCITYQAPPNLPLHMRR